MVEQDYALIDIVAWIVIGLISVSYFYLLYHFFKTHMDADTRKWIARKVNNKLARMRWLGSVYHKYKFKHLKGVDEVKYSKRVELNTQWFSSKEPVLHSSFKTNNWRSIFTGNKLNASEFLTRDIAIYFIDYIPYQR